MTLVPAILALTLLAAGDAAAPSPASSPAATPVVSAPAHRVPGRDRAGETPRRMLQTWLDSAREGKLAEAAALMELPPGMEDRGPEVARRLKAVLDRHLWFDMNAVSDAPEGSPDDGAPADVEVIGTVPGPSGPESVLLVRRNGEWRFSQGTVERIDAWFGTLPDRWAITWLPEPLLRPGPKELLWWQWLSLPVLSLVAFVVGRLAARITMTMLGAAARRTAPTWDDKLVARARGPIALAWGTAVAWALIPLLDLYPPAQAFLHDLLATGFYLSLFWLGLRGVDIAGAEVAETQWARDRALSNSLVPLGTRSAKVLVAALALIAVLSTLGYPVASLLAGLGIGGLAVALAAQKTVENVFGAFSIGVDQPFREGDFVKIEDFVGTVEKIGLRSTRIRTLGRTIISLPNGKLADMRIETFAVRDRILLSCTLGLVYDTTAAQMRQILEGLEKRLRAHPKLWPDSLSVRFAAMNASSLDVEIMAWFQTTDWDEFTRIRQDVFLQFIEVVEGAGSSFAFPTRTVHMIPAEAKARALG